MSTSRTIATCCYCGTRAALVLTGKTRHELSCSSCGAPLHDLKALRSDHKGKPSLAGPPRRRPPREMPESQSRRKLKRKSVAQRLLGEAIDLIEDIFD